MQPAFDTYIKINTPYGIYLKVSCVSPFKIPERNGGALVLLLDNEVDVSTRDNPNQHCHTNF
jgi:hypothetical protein